MSLMKKPGGRRHPLCQPPPPPPRAHAVCHLKPPPPPPQLPQFPPPTSSRDSFSFLCGGGRERFINVLKAGGGRVIFSPAPSGGGLKHGHVGGRRQQQHPPHLCFGVGGTHLNHPSFRYAPQESDVYTPLWLFHRLQGCRNPETPPCDPSTRLPLITHLKPAHLARASPSTSSFLSRSFGAQGEPLNVTHTEASLRTLLEKTIKKAQREATTTAPGPVLAGSAAVSSSSSPLSPAPPSSALSPHTLVEKLKAEGGLTGTLFWGLGPREYFDVGGQVGGVGKGGGGGGGGGCWGL